MMTYTFYCAGTYYVEQACTAIDAFTKLRKDYGVKVWDEAFMVSAVSA